MSFLAILAVAVIVGLGAGLALPHRAGSLIAAACAIGGALWAWFAIAGELETTRPGHVLIGFVFGGFLAAALAAGVVTGAVLRRSSAR